MNRKSLIIIFIILFASSIFGWVINKESKYQYVDTLIHAQSSLKFEQQHNYFDDVNKLVEYQNYQENQLNEIYTKNSFEDSLIIYNQYGIDRFSANIYFDYESEYETGFAYKIAVEGFDDFYRSNDNMQIDSEHAHLINGLIPGHNNLLTIYLYNEYQLLEEKTINIDLSPIDDIEIELNMPINLESSDYLDTYLFAVFGKNDDMPKGNTQLYDQNGVIRAEFLSDNNYRADRLIKYQDNIVYSYDDNVLVSINNLNKIENVYYLWQYQMHHDYLLNNDELLVLVSDQTTDSIEDILISVNLIDGSVRELIDFKELMPTIYEYAQNNNQGNNYGSNYLDWIHINSIEFVGDNSLLFSSRELSSIIKIDNIHESPKISYIVSNDYIFDNIDDNHEFTLINGDNNFYGQHSLQVTRIDDSSYYLELFNNAWANSPSYPYIPWDQSSATLDFIDSDASSYYEKYIVNEEALTIELVDKTETIYSSIVSSIQNFGEYKLIAPGYNLDKGAAIFVYRDDELIKKFRFDKTYTVFYRVFATQVR